MLKDRNIQVRGVKYTGLAIFSTEGGEHTLNVSYILKDSNDKIVFLNNTDGKEVIEGLKELKQVAKKYPERKEIFDALIAYFHD